MNYFLDTNICIYFLSGRYPKVVERLARTIPDRVKIPTIVKAELCYGAKKSNKSPATMTTVENFLNPYEIVPFCPSAADIYADIRFGLEQIGKTIGPNDFIIAATVLANNGILITNNTREFSRIAGLRLENWTK